MANIIDKGQITLQGGAIMSWNITDDEVLTISGALWDGSVTVGKAADLIVSDIGEDGFKVRNVYVAAGDDGELRLEA